MIYNQIPAKQSFSFTLGENALEIVGKYKLKNVCKKIIRIWLNKLGKQYSQLEIIVTLYFKIVSSKISSANRNILIYGDEVLFSGKEIFDFEMAHLSSLKNMIGVKHISYYLYGYRKVSSLFKTANYIVDILDSLDLLA